MAMTRDEKALVTETVEALGALSFVLGAMFKVLNQDLSNLQPRMLAAVNTLTPGLATTQNTQRMLALARAYITTL